MGGYQDLRGGGGVAVVPELCRTKDDRRRLAVRSTGDVFGRDSYGVVTRRGMALPPAARELIRLVDPGFPELAPRGGQGLAGL
ncbi:MAG: hypothetical protein IPP35_07920 [Elusimicrobia bacterium]|nr:hypothetical protein [Elusimicrobiota bacterium]